MKLRYLLYALLLCLFITSRVASQSYSGSLYYQNDISYGLDVVASSAVNSWRSSLEVDWVVTRNISNPGFPWTYVYTVNVNPSAAPPRRLLIETGSDFSLADIDLSSVLVSIDNTPQIYDTSNISVGLFTPTTAQGSNFYLLPEVRYGVLFNNLTDGGRSFETISIQFDSFFEPGWGDMYLNCTDCQGPRNVGWNSGFLLPETTEPPTDGSRDNRILVPRIPIPEPGTLLLICSGIALILTGRSRR